MALAVRIWLQLAFDTENEDQPVATRTMAPTHPFAGTVDARTLPPGACLDRVPSGLGFVRPVPCNESHLAEIVGAFPFPAPPGGPYPPITELFGQSLDRCKTEFNAYTGTTPDQTPASSFVAVPSPSEWDRGERLVVCYATARNGGALTASVRGRR